MDVYATEYDGECNIWSLKSWDQPGFFFALGSVPVPTGLTEETFVVYVMPDAASIQATTKLDVQDVDVEGTAASELQSLGLGFAQLRIEFSG